MSAGEWSSAPGVKRERTIEPERFATYIASLSRIGRNDAGRKSKDNLAGIPSTVILASPDRCDGGNNRAGHLAATARHARA